MSIENIKSTTSNIPYTDIKNYSNKIFEFIKDSGIDMNSLDDNFIEDLILEESNTGSNTGSNSGSNTGSNTGSNSGSNTGSKNGSKSRSKTNIIESSSSSTILCDATYEMAMMNIPEMFISTGMIILDGYINDKPLKILLDTGASTSVIFNYAVKRFVELLGITKPTTS
jgi:hypothetical protein